MAKIQVRPRDMRPGDVLVERGLSPTAAFDAVFGGQIEKISHVYSGRPGCCCGCRGSHRYASAHADRAAARRGYAVGKGEINDRQIKKVVNLLRRAPMSRLDIQPNYVALETDSKLWVAYVD